MATRTLIAGERTRHAAVGRSLARDALGRLLRNRAACAGMATLGIIALLAILAPWISPHPYDAIYWDKIAIPPDLHDRFYFGTDSNGRDLFARTLYGGRVSLMGRPPIGRL